MATIKFLLQSKTENSQIYIRVSSGRDLYLKKKTGLLINSKDWSKIKGLPKNNLDKKDFASEINEKPIANASFTNKKVSEGD